MLKSLRWVILRDAAILLGKHSRVHYLFTDSMRNVFKLVAFKDYQTKLMVHIADSLCNDPNEACVESVLPGVTTRLDNIHVGIKEVCTSVIEGNTQIQSLPSEFSNFESNNTASMREVMKGEAKAGVNGMCSFIGTYHVMNGDDIHEANCEQE